MMTAASLLTRLMRASRTSFLVRGHQLLPRPSDALQLAQQVALCALRQAIPLGARLEVVQWSIGIPALLTFRGRAHVHFDLALI